MGPFSPERALRATGAAASVSPPAALAALAVWLALPAPLTAQASGGAPLDASAPRRPDAGLVISHPAAAGSRGFGLGDGGIASIARDVPEAVDEGICLTPGGVRVHSLAQGTKLTFPNGREVLLAPDGYLHLYRDAVAGPFPGGVELQLGDGSKVCFDRNGSRRTPITQVVVHAGGRSLRIWRRTKAVAEAIDPLRWAGERLICLGDGGALYRPAALGPLLILARVLVPKDQEERLPPERLVLDLDALLASVAVVLEEHRRDDTISLRRLREFAVVGPRVLADTGRRPIRVGSNPLSYELPRGYTIEFRADPAMLRMRLGEVDRAAFVEWKLGYESTVHAVEVDQPYGGRPIRVPAPPAELALRVERNELPRALTVFEALRSGRR